MRVLFAGVAQLALAACSIGPSSRVGTRDDIEAPTAASGQQRELMQLSRRRFAAFLDGDRATYREIVSPDAIFAYSNGRVLTFDDAIAELVPLAPPGSYEFRHEDVHLRAAGGGALLVYRLVAHGPGGIGDYEGIESDFFVRRDGAWKLIAVHGSTIPYPTRPSVALDTTALDAYVGRYDGALNAHYDITRNGTVLVGQRSGFPAIPWIVESKDVFFVPSDPTATRVFVRDERGQISALIRIDVSGDTRWTRRNDRERRER